MRLRLLPRVLRPRLPSRRRWLLGVTAGLFTAAVLPAYRRVRKRRPGDPAPTGWFGHC